MAITMKIILQLNVTVYEHVVR